MFQSSPACFLCVSGSFDVVNRTGMKTCRGRLHTWNLSHDACNRFRQSIQVLNSPLLANFLLLLLYISVSPPHKSYSVMDRWFIGNKKRSKLIHNKVFLLTCWNLAKVRSRDDFNWPNIPQNRPFNTSTALH